MLLAVSGSFSRALEFQAWFKAGAVAKDFPEALRNDDDYAEVLVIHQDGRIHKYESGGPCPIAFDSGQQFAMGSGRDYAMAAMHLGNTADEAVLVACVFDAGCGNGVDTLKFEDLPETQLL